MANVNANQNNAVTVTKTYYRVTFVYGGKQMGDNYPGRESLDDAMRYIGKLLQHAEAAGFKFFAPRIEFNTITSKAEQ